MSSMKAQLAVGLFSSLSFCGLRSKILKNIAFQPPPVSYTLKPINHGRKSLLQLSSHQDIHEVRTEELRDKSKSYDDESMFQDLGDFLQQIKDDKVHSQIKTKHLVDSQEYPRHDFFLIDGDGKEISIPPQGTTTITGYFLKTRKDHKIASLYLSDYDSDYVILFSHGNASDLGFMIDTLLDLQVNLKINIFAYEYSGYGQSNGKCSDLNIIKDIQTAYEFLVMQLNFDPNKIIIYGYSIGSGPSVTLASNPSFPVGGLVIHSGLSSGLRLVNEKIKKTPFYDLFPNVDRIKNVQCPVFILHGNDDEIIQFQHAQLLAQNCQTLYELWEVDKAGHSGIDSDRETRITYFTKLRKFTQAIIEQSQTIKELQEKGNLSPKAYQKHYYNKIREIKLDLKEVSYD